MARLDGSRPAEQAGAPDGACSRKDQRTIGKRQAHSRKRCAGVDRDSECGQGRQQQHDAVMRHIAQKAGSPDDDAGEEKSERARKDPQMQRRDGADFGQPEHQDLREVAVGIDAIGIDNMLHHPGGA
ncbi:MULTISPECIES: hypothetical protein [unclassified Bradyrhizobium]|uniref:hypothetical protein n=1 Tax=unclassified Bradyrhizobium TaxID=2631580 RepID=UPI002916D3DF|nr:MULTISPECIES: hypothetical protein [unclassified Bradyrhizobium]